MVVARTTSHGSTGLAAGVRGWAGGDGDGGARPAQTGPRHLDGDWCDSRLPRLGPAELAGRAPPSPSSGVHLCAYTVGGAESRKPGRAGTDALVARGIRGRVEFGTCV